jgi:hypothetical protein
MKNFNQKKLEKFLKELEQEIHEVETLIKTAKSGGGEASLNDQMEQAGALSAGAEVAAAGAAGAAGVAGAGEDVGVDQETDPSKAKDPSLALTLGKETAAPVSNSSGMDPLAEHDGEDGGEGTSPMDVFGAILNTAKFGWEIVKDGAPVASAQSSFCSAMPKDVPMTELYGWKNWTGKFYVNKYDSWPSWLGGPRHVIDAEFRATSVSGGRTDRAPGLFLQSFSIWCKSVDVGWGWSLSANANVKGEAYNSGTKKGPVGAIQVLFQYSYSTLLFAKVRSWMYTAHGNGKVESQ